LAERSDHAIVLATLAAGTGRAARTAVGDWLPSPRAVTTALAIGAAFVLGAIVLTPGLPGGVGFLAMLGSLLAAVLVQRHGMRQRERVRRLLLRARRADDLLPECIACGYDLRHLPSDRCPECGSSCRLADVLRQELAEFRPRPAFAHLPPHVAAGLEMSVRRLVPKPDIGLRPVELMALALTTSAGTSLVFCVVGIDSLLGGVLLGLVLVLPGVVVSSVMLARWLGSRRRHRAAVADFVLQSLEDGVPKRCWLSGQLL
jgi:hypothetical protein